MAIHRKPEHIFKEYGLTRAPKQHNPAHTTNVFVPRPRRIGTIGTLPGDQPGRPIGNVPPSRRGRRFTGPRRSKVGGRSSPSRAGIGMPIGNVPPSRRGRRRTEGTLPGNQPGFALRRPPGVIPPSPFGRGVSSSFGSRRRRPLRRHRARR